MDDYFEPLKKWFIEERRELPWRTHRTPYSTWVSEVMLQQTQVSVVIPYFLRWMETFPSIAHLAAASWEEVVKMWEGLGYYSRAKNLHEGAKEVVAQFNGKLPSDPETLRSIKGIGPYTSGAILSFAFEQKKGAIDGNVARVLSRLFLIEDPIDVEKTKVKLLTILEKHLPDEKPWLALEGLIELGALICQRTPKCHLCPQGPSCIAFKEGKTSLVPTKKNKVQITNLYRNVAVVESNESLLLKRGKEGEVMGYLYEFPYLETTKEGIAIHQIEKDFMTLLSLPLNLKTPFKEVSHGFTRFQVSLFPFHFSGEELPVPSPYLWVKKESLKEIPFSSGHRRILKTWEKNHALFQ